MPCKKASDAKKEWICISGSYPLLVSVARYGGGLSFVRWQGDLPHPDITIIDVENNFPMSIAV